MAKKIKDTAKIACIGCGNHATGSIHVNFSKIPELDLVAMCDLDEAKAKRSARVFGALRHYTSMDTMLDSEELDGVFVVGPSPMQFEVAKQVLKAGLPLFVEKPPATTWREARHLADLAKKRKTFGVVAFMKRFARCYSLAKEITETKEFGDLHVIDSKFSNGPYPPELWGVDWESAGQAFLTGQCVHHCDLVQYFGGPVAEVYANYTEAATGCPGFAITLQFAAGAIGLMNLNSYDSWYNFDERLGLSGCGQYVTVDKMMTMRYFKGEPIVPLSQPGLDKNQALISEPSGPVYGDSKLDLGYLGEVKHFVDCCRGAAKPSPNLEDGVQAMRLVDAIWRSGRDHKVVKLR